MKAESVTLNKRELGILEMLEQIKHQSLSVSEAARRLGMSRRQLIRRKARYEQHGAGGLVHRLRGRPGNRRAAGPVHREQAIALYRERYGGFGPTLAAQKLEELDQIGPINPQTLRRWLIASGDWGPRPARRGGHRQRRARRPRLGQMLQLDGSDHAWFEDRAAPCCLMVLIDDATGRMMLHMAPSETTQAALQIVRKWALAYGLPESLYTDRNTVYWSQTALDNPHLRARREHHSEWGRVMVGNLGIGLIAAHSPQAKGRVERANATLQDRLVKELRLLGISSIQAANAMLDRFALDLNARFAKPALEPLDAHRVFAPADPQALELAFSVDHTRTVTHDNTVSLHARAYQLAPQPAAPAPGTKVTLWQGLDGTVRASWQGRVLAIAPFDLKADRFRHKVYGGEPKPHEPLP